MERGLVAGQVILGQNTTITQMVVVWGITPSGVEPVEGHSAGGLAINFGIINVNSPVSQSQQAVGSNISQTQSPPTNNFLELYSYIDEKLDKPRIYAVKPLVEKLETQTKTDSVQVSTIRKIRETITTWGPVGLSNLEAVLKLSGVKS